MSAPADCPILVWMLSLNREYTKDEYDSCYRVVKECVEHVQIPYNPRDADSFRQLITLMLPLLMMRHRRIPRSRWTDKVWSNGKHYIEQAEDDMSPEKFMHSMIGYHLTWEHSLCGMAMTQGIRKRVVNIGMATKQFAVEPKGASVAAYIESQSHKLTPFELSTLNSESDEETMLRRLCIIIALKNAYIRAIGQPIGFDYSRLEFNIPDQSVIGDGHPLQGWEFRIWRTNLGVARRENLISEYYECAVAFFRGTPESRFIWQESSKELESWVQFINIDQMVKVIPKLTA